MRRILRALGLQLVVRQLRVLSWELETWARDCAARLRARRYRHARGLKANLGCGPKLKAGWVNVDAVPQAELHLDLRKPLPFSSGSFTWTRRTSCSARTTLSGSPAPALIGT